MSLAWMEQWSVGNSMIDSDHRNLVDLVNNVEQALRGGDRLVLSQAFKQLWNSVALHCANEERIAQAINFQVDKHRLAHQYLQDELQYIREELEDKCGVWSEGAIEHFTRFLGDWLIEHVTREDVQMKPALQTLPYDFVPA
ncbi:MAG TPA: hemerythrin family protein [Gallionella sp.]|nr:hemerythrin family protein [Gallionella sp.]